VIHPPSQNCLRDFSTSQTAIGLACAIVVVEGGKDRVADIHEDDFGYDFWYGYTIDTNTNSNDATAGGNEAQYYCMQDLRSNHPVLLFLFFFSQFRGHILKIYNISLRLTRLQNFQSPETSKPFRNVVFRFVII
jgi:hypothetical protein